MSARNPETFKEVGAMVGGFVPADDGKYQVVRDLDDDGQEARGQEIAGREVVMAEPEGRGRWMSVLAQASASDLEEVWQALDDHPPYRLIRGPEIGSVMVRGRAGGTGARFCLGEMTVTRCSVALDDGRIGHACVGGRSAPHAEHAAVLDALLQDPALTDTIAMVSLGPASHVGLDDRGEIAVGKRADLVRVRLAGDLPVVRGVWCRGERVA